MTLKEFLIRILKVVAAIGISMAIAGAILAVTLLLVSREAEDFEDRSRIAASYVFNISPGPLGNEYTNDQDGSSYMYRSDSYLVLPDFPGEFTVRALARDMTTTFGLDDVSSYRPPGLVLNSNAPDSVIGGISEPGQWLELGPTSPVTPDTIWFYNDFYSPETGVDVNILVESISFSSASVEELYGEKLLITWSPVLGDTDVVSYKIQMNIPQGVSRSWEVSAPDTHAVIRNLPTDFYQFSVNAIDRSGNISSDIYGHSPVVLLTVPDTAPPYREPIIISVTISLPDSLRDYPIEFDFQSVSDITR